MEWTYNGYKYNEIGEGYEGFVYLLTFEDGRKYIGKKNFFTYKVLPALASGLVRINAERIYKNLYDKVNPKYKNGKQVKVRTPLDRLARESHWRNYEGSIKHSSELPRVIKKEILYLCISKRELTYIEVRELFKVDAIFNTEYINENINGTWFNNVHDKLKGK